MRDNEHRSSFLKDVSEHKMSVSLDQDLFRHIRFAKDGTSNMMFTLTTWPGHLCFAGDMGTFVFSRIKDMFEFFRRDADASIDFRYWAEKCDGIDRSGLEVFDRDKFKQVINELAGNHGEDLKQAIADEVLSLLDDGEFAAQYAAHNFQFNGFQFHNLWEYNFNRYGYRFIWCCFAIVWGINQYDDAKDKAVSTKNG